VREALAQALPQPQPFEQRLEHHEPGKGSELLILEADLGQRASFPMNFGSANRLVLRR
jgi:hypothetical protein